MRCLTIGLSLLFAAGLVVLPGETVFSADRCERRVGSEEVNETAEADREKEGGDDGDGWEIPLSSLVLMDLVGSVMPDAFSPDPVSPKTGTRGTPPGAPTGVHSVPVVGPGGGGSWGVVGVPTGAGGPTSNVSITVNIQ